MYYAERYDRAAGWIVDHCGAADKMVHTYVGLAIWVCSFLILRRRPGSAVALLPVLAAEIVNECLDRAAHGSWMWRDTIGDAAATWFWPLLLTAVLDRMGPGALRS